MERLVFAPLTLLVAQIAGDTAPVFYYWNPTLQHNFVTATTAGAQYASSNGYQPLVSDASLPSNTTHVQGTIPLLQYYSYSRNDFMLLASRDSKVEAEAANYTLIRIEGFVFAAPATGLVEMRQYWSAARNDHFLVVRGSQHETDAIGAKYALLRVEGYVRQQLFPAFTWESNPPSDIPFARSSIFTEIEFTGRYATYGGADTWYPTWAADGNLYTPWTDGTVNGVGASSACATAGCMATTGFATVIGDDPLNLTLEAVGTFSSSPSPYHGRYPCGSLFFNDTWFYGTYALDNENHQPGNLARNSANRLTSGRAGYCENWCIQGPFAGFRWSRDKGKTWNEPRLHMQSWDDNIFGEKAPDNHTYKVKYGAPHVVDLGRELEHVPAGDERQMMYVVGHGTTHAYSPSSWMQGSDVHMARVVPSIESVQDRTQWEFYAGEGSWVKGDVTKAQPLISWGNRTGVTTMTYIPAANRYIMCISTPTYSPFTEKQFDTYFLESENITGPFNYITYMRQFGPESYFVNIPSKFVAPTVDPQDGSITMYLSYSANFAFHQSANPPGSGYHWTLQEIKFKPGELSALGKMYV